MADAAGSAAAGRIGPTKADATAGRLGGNALDAFGSRMVQDAVQREVSIGLGDDHVQSWRQITEDVFGNALGNAAIAAIRAYELPAVNVPEVPIDIAQPTTSIVVGDIPQSIASVGLAQRTTFNAAPSASTQPTLVGLRAQLEDLQARYSAGTVSNTEFGREYATINNAFNGLGNASDGGVGGMSGSGSSMGRSPGSYENGELNVNIYDTAEQIQASPAMAASDSAMSSVSYDSVRDAVGHALFPTIEAFSERGVPGTWGSKFVGAGKQLWNTALGMYDLMSGGALASSLTGVPSPASLSQAYIADNELAGAAIVEGGLFVLPSVAGKVGQLGRLGEMGGEVRVPKNTIVDSEVSALKRIAANNSVDTGSAARMARIDELATANYNQLLQNDLAKADYVYRAVPEKMLGIYRAQGSISGRGGSSTYFSLEGGASPLQQKLGAQLIDEPQVLLKIPTSELVGPTVPRPFGYSPVSRTFGREYFVNSYPQYGAGGFRQFIGTTNSYSDSWIVSPWGTR